MLTLGPFPYAKTTFNLLWISKNVTNITKALNIRQNIKQKTYLDLIGKFDLVGKMTLYGICEGWLNSWHFPGFHEIRESIFDSPLQFYFYLEYYFT